MGEFWDLYDINRNKLGRLHKRGQQLSEGEYHLVVEVWVINSNYEILLTQRHPNKRWGNYWECTGGAVTAGEDSSSAAQRELSEETGIKVTNEEIVFLGSTTNKDWFTDTYLVKLSVPTWDFILQEEEVIDARWVSINEFEVMCSKGLIVPSTINRFNIYKDKIDLR